MTSPAKAARLGNHTLLISSGSTPRGGESVYLKHGPVMLIRSQNVRMNQLDLSDAAFISNEIDADMRRSVVQRGDVFLNITGASIGRVAMFDLPDVRANVNQHVCIIRPKPEELDSKYLLYYLSGPQMQRDINDRHQHGGTRQALTFSQIADFEIPLPPLPEQRRIAAILDQADRVRRKRQAALALTDQFLRSTFLEMFGDPVRNPKKWEMVDLGSIAEVQGGLQVTSKRASCPLEVPYLRVANVYRDRLDLTEIKTIRVTEAERNRVALRAGDILVVEGHGNREEIGRCAVWDGSIEPCVHQNHLIRVRVNATLSLPEYISAFVNSPAGRRQLFGSSNTTSGLNTISTSTVKETAVLLPPIADQRRFVAARHQWMRSCSTMIRSADACDDLFSTLVQRAFRGEL